ncbi:MAG: carbohydrate kinase family protein [Patescibacteria group bacterium]|nr:carbohydrate kinase family protein [Patescibacteria group bacterium]
MPLKSSSLVAVAGSLAVDMVMDFPGRFSDYIIPGKIHDLSLSFSLDKIRPGFGGTAGNIAYNLALLKERSSILTAVGSDFGVFRRHLQAYRIDLSGVSVNRRDRCAAAFIMTDKSDNQIAGFYPGPTVLPNFSRLDKKEISLLIISPDAKERMIAAQSWAKKRKLPYIFDPGQQVISFSAAELKKMIHDSILVIGNDYETEIMKRQLKVKSLFHVSPKHPLIITKGAQGSEILELGRKISITALPALKAIDPTGAGDAYRAGLIKGLQSGLTLEKAAKLAATVAVYAVESQGTQNHKFTLNGLLRRYQRHFGETLTLA